MKFVIKKASGVLVAAALALLLNTKGYAEEPGDQEALINPTVAEQQASENNTSTTTGTNDSTTDSQTNSSSDSSGENNVHDLGTPAVPPTDSQTNSNSDSSGENNAQSLGEPAVPPTDSQTNSNSDSSGENNAQSLGEPAVPPTDSQTNNTTDTTDANNGQGTGEQTGTSTDSQTSDSTDTAAGNDAETPAATPTLTVTAGSTDTELTETNRTNWSDDRKQGWFYDGETSALSMVNSELSAVSATGRDVSIVAAGYNHIETLSVDSGNISVIGSGILLIDNVEIIGEEYSFNLLELENNRADSSGSVAVFLWDEEQKAYVLRNGSIAGILDDFYAIPAGVKLVVPEGSSLVLTTTMPENMEEVQHGGTAGTLIIRSGAELEVAGSVQVKAGGYTQISATHFEDTNAISTLTVQGEMKLLAGGSVHVEGDLKVDGGVLDCQDYITTGTGKSWSQEGDTINRKGRVEITAKTSSSYTTTETTMVEDPENPGSLVEQEVTVQRNSNLMLDNSTVVVKANGVTIDSITTKGSCTLGVGGGDSFSDWTLTVGDITVVEGALDYEGYLGRNNCDFECGSVFEICTSTLHVTGTVSGSGVMKTHLDVQVFDQAPQIPVQTTAGAVVVPKGTTTVQGSSKVSTGTEACLNSTNVFTVELVRYSSGLTLDKYLMPPNGYSPMTTVSTNGVRLGTYTGELYDSEGVLIIPTDQWGDNLNFTVLNYMRSSLYEYQDNDYSLQRNTQELVYYLVTYNTATGGGAKIVSSGSNFSVPLNSVTGIRVFYYIPADANAIGSGAMNTDTTVSTTGSISSGASLTPGSGTNLLAVGKAPSQSPSTDNGNQDQSGDNQGQGGDNQGQGGDNQGQSGENQGQGGENQGQSGENQGQGGENQGQGGDNQGQSGENQGQGGDNQGSDGGETDSDSGNTDPADSTQTPDAETDSDIEIVQSNPGAAQLVIRVEPAAKQNHYELFVWDGNNKLNLGSGNYRAKMAFSMPKSWNPTYVFAVFTQTDGSLKAVQAKYDAATGTLSFDAPQTGDFLLICFPYEKDFYTDAFYKDLADWIELMG